MEPADSPRRRKRIRKWIETIVALVALAAIGADWMVKNANLSALEKAAGERLAADEERLRSVETADAEQSARELAKLEAEHQARMSDPTILDGSKARAAREEEWKRRLAHDPKLALSLAERKLIEMEKLGADAQISARAALEKVAELSAPRGSRIEVTSEGDQFAVKVAYKMSALTYGESGAATKHETRASMRAEVRELSAQIVRDLFTYCGSRGISSISLTCNHTLLSTLIPLGATAEEKQTLERRAKKTQSKLYRVIVEGPTARNISNWQRASDEEVLRLLKVDFDGIESVHLSGARSVDHSESDEPLLF